MKLAKHWRILLGCFACLPLVATISQARPFLVSGQGQHYDLRAACLDGESTWIGGAVQAPVGLWDQPAFGDAFLVCLGPDGKTLWEKRFGSKEGGEAVELIAKGQSDDIYIAGYASCNLAYAWQESNPEVDWNREGYLARLDKTGQLKRSVELRAEATDSNIEPYLLLQSIACSATGEVYVGASLRGRIGEQQSPPGQMVGQAVLMTFSRDLVLEAIDPIPGNSLTQLDFGSGALWGAGTSDAVEGAEMAPTHQRPVVWNLGMPSPKIVWSGKVAENTKCLQLGDHLLYRSNELEGAIRVNLATGEFERENLPAGTITVTAWQATNLAGGERSQEWLEAPSAVLWRQDDQSWHQLAAEATQEWDKVQFLLPSQQSLTAVGTGPGDRPGETRWLCWRINQLPPAVDVDR